MEHKLKAYATEFRNINGYSSSEPINFDSLLQQLDIITIFKKCDNFSGLCIKEKDSKFILINSDHSIGRQNFTIAHELYHLYFDKDFLTHKCQPGIINNKNEKRADIFATHLVLPEDGIVRLIPDDEDKKDKISLGSILKIEHTYKCSRAALLNKLEKLKLISKDFKEKYKTGIKSGAQLYGYSTDLYSKTKERALLGSYGNLANKLFQEEKISEGHYTELMLAIGVDITESIDDEEDQ